MASPPAAGRLVADTVQPPTAAALPAGRTDPPAPYRRTNGFRPDATNEWDRMPAEIQNKILDAASPLTKFVNGLLLAAELHALSETQREQVWQDANDVDWQGDLDLLPRVDFASKNLKLHSRSLFDRLKPRLAAWSAARVAVLNGWADLFDYNHPQLLERAAVEAGDLHLLRDLIDTRKIVVPRPSLIQDLASRGHLDAIKFMDSRIRSSGWSRLVGYSAAKSGSLDLVVWLSEHHPECLDAAAFEGAASRGHMHIVRWLADNCKFGCMWHALRVAAELGSFEMLTFLHERYSSALADAPQGASFVSTDIRVIEWLDERGLANPLHIVLHIVKMSRIDTLEWAVARFGIELGQIHLDEAHRRRNNAVIMWAYERGMPFTRDGANTAAWLCNIELMNWVISRERGSISMLVDATAKLGNPPLVEWWRERHGVVFGQRELEVAIREYNCSLAEHLLAIEDADWDFVSLSAALVASEQAIDDENDAWLEEVAYGWAMFNEDKREVVQGIGAAIQAAATRRAERTQ
nr:hypothetical protein HK105_000438 [Polyrhizophydium stewartii]